MELLAHDVCKALYFCSNSSPTSSAATNPSMSIRGAGNAQQSGLDSRNRFCFFQFFLFPFTQRSNFCNSTPRLIDKATLQHLIGQTMTMPHVVDLPDVVLCITRSLCLTKAKCSQTKRTYTNTSQIIHSCTLLGFGQMVAMDRLHPFENAMRKEH